MKKISFIVVIAGLMLCGCKLQKNVDETVETERYTLHIQDLDSHAAANGGKRYLQHFSSTGDTTIFSNTIPQMALYLASMTQGPHFGSTMWYIDMSKQKILPAYVHTIIDHDCTQPVDFTPLLHALIEKNILSTDTTYEPMQLLVMFDSARFAAHRKMEADLEFLNIASIVVQLREDYRIPLTLDDSLDMGMMMTDRHFFGDDWQQDSLWLDERGLRVIPDPQGRQMCIITFNRAKGRI